MLHIRGFVKFLDTLFASIWGITVIDLIPELSSDIFVSVDNSIKMIMAILGVIYFAISIYFKFKNNQVDNKIKEVELESKEFELSKRKKDGIK